ncbi:DNA-binding protein [Enemella dayhoffiae]|uniref:DNA-binding protein n=1 Tax=Enemella dayhoffiae TaxID=2016507 RepID=A0A255GM58_9ACTN|nr:helix-turn-helix domain-containing protein [Enemella dayhoffiae]OYO16651.1 DNA-binding protein [Enemella dayhoffiae]
MTNYNAILTIDKPYVGAWVEPFTDRVHEQFRRYSPATAGGRDGRAQVIITLPATTLEQATQTATALLVEGEDWPAEPCGLEVLTTELYDRLGGFTLMPDLVSISEAAEQLGISRQAVLQRIESGRLPASKVGSAWVIASANLA